VVGLGTGVLRLYGSISGLPHCGWAYRGGVRIDRCISAQNSEEWPKAFTPPSVWSITSGDADGIKIYTTRHMPF